MQKLDWPGIATAVGLLVVATIVIAMYRDPNFMLKDWQTLMAACVALIGGVYAYQSAMAKVEFDRETAEFNLRRERTSLYLKVQIALELFSADVMRQRRWADVPRGQLRKLTVADLQIVPPRELDDAWDKLDLFSDNVVYSLANIRSTVRVLALAADVWPKEYGWSFTTDTKPEEIDRFIDLCRNLEEYCTVATNEIRQNVKIRVVH